MTKLLITQNDKGGYRVSYIFYGDEMGGQRSSINIGVRHKYNRYIGRVFERLKRWTYREEVKE